MFSKSNCTFIGMIFWYILDNISRFSWRFLDFRYGAFFTLLFSRQSFQVLKQLLYMCIKIQNASTQIICIYFASNTYLSPSPRLIRQKIMIQITRSPREKISQRLYHGSLINIGKLLVFETTRRLCNLPYERSKTTENENKRWSSNRGFPTFHAWQISIPMWRDS